jgi:hypothetical protein
MISDDTVDLPPLDPEDAELLLDEVDGDDDSNEHPLIPWCDTTDDEFGARWVDYVDRGPRDVVVSGPVTGGWGPGRWHKNRRIAYWRLVGKFGADRVKPTKQSQGRWSFLIKNLRQNEP